VRRLIIALSCILAANPALAENWPQWRGPENDGISHETDLPVTWSKTEGVMWRLPLPGPAGATPVVWEDSIFLTTATPSGDLLLLCVGTDGKERWREKVTGGDRTVRGDEGNSASPSPATDGEHVWTFFANGVLGCYDFSGQEVWKEDLQKRYGKFVNQFGLTSTPVLDGDRLYVQLLHSGAALVLALDKATGKEIWRQTRKSDARAECEHSYASPVLYRDGDREFLLTHGCDYIVAHSLEDGHELWRCGELNPKGSYNPTLRFVASPLAVPGLIVVPSAKNGPVLGLRPDAQGDISGTSKAHQWVRPQNTPDVSSPLVVDGLVYLCRENGVLICMDAQSGKEIYQERAHSDRYRASPVYADGKIYLTARGGVITVVKAGPEFEILSSNDMQEPISASPVISNGRIYLRTFEALYAISKK
jgi:outer membrane protein assembly factor BamB